MSNLKEHAIRAFKEGSDNYGEQVTNEVSNLVFNEGMRYFSITVHLIETVDGKEHRCTSGIGFYPNGPIAEATELRVCSGHMMNWTVQITDELRKELLNADVEKW